jgi:phospholipid/cholesterol/gamma-HCH transport system substrate-binding protein
MPVISKEMKLALLGIAAIALFVFGYSYLKGTALFSSTQILQAEYDDVQGLTPASYVQLQGFNVGTVKDIQLSKTNPGKVLVTLSIDKKLAIPNDSKAMIISSDLLGTKAVNLIKGSSTTLVEENAFLKGDITPGALDGISSAATPAIDQAAQTLASLDVTVKSMNNILDATTQANLKRSIEDAGKTMHDVSQFANTLNAQRAEVTRLIQNLNAFSSTLEKNGATITRVLNNAEVTTENLKKADLEGTIASLKGTLQKLETTIEQVSHGNGSMALLMNDDKLYRNLKNTLATANNLLADINARPSRYINVSVFGKKSKSDCPPPPAPNAND